MPTDHPDRRADARPDTRSDRHAHLVDGRGSRPDAAGTGVTDATPATLAARLDAVERALTGTDADVSALEDVAAVEERVAALEDAVETLTDRLDEVDAATQAVRGYLGGVRAVNEDVERRADAALAKAESLEARLVDESPTARDAAGPSDASTPPTPSTASTFGAGTGAADPSGDAPTGEGTARQSDDGLAARLRDVL